MMKTGLVQNRYKNEKKCTVKTRKHNLYPFLNPNFSAEKKGWDFSAT